MNVLVLGGSGHVGTAIMPVLRKDFRVRVFDVKPPADGDVEYMPGDVTDPAAVARAVEGMDALAYLVMPPREHLRDIGLSYDRTLKGLHLALEAAHLAGIRRAVYASTGSVHGGYSEFPHEDIACSAADIYGFTKALGERICQWFANTREMTVVALRLFGPMSAAQWKELADKKQNPYYCTSPVDTGRAFAAALTSPLSGFHAIFVSGDYENKVVRLARAKALLNWEPLDRLPARV